MCDMEGVGTVHQNQRLRKKKEKPQKRICSLRFYQTYSVSILSGIVSGVII